MQFLLMSLFALGIVALDQWTKFLVLQNIPLYGHVDAIEGLFHLTYVRNTGAAFSAFAGAQWLFALIFVALTVGIFYEYFKKRQPFTNFERWLIAAIYGGGVGNMIDRVALGYVVDMIDFYGIWPYIFNVADSCVCIGAGLMILHFILAACAEYKASRDKDGGAS
jgi:signal peptidase II